MPAVKFQRKLGTRLKANEVITASVARRKAHITSRSLHHKVTTTMSSTVEP